MFQPITHLCSLQETIDNRYLRNSLGLMMFCLRVTATLLLMCRVGGQRVTLRHVSNRLPPNEVGHRRGSITGPFPLPPSQTTRASFPACRFPEKHSFVIGKKRGFMHYAATQPMTLQEDFSCHPLPCGRPSRPPWWDVTSTTHYGGAVTMPLARFR